MIQSNSASSALYLVAAFLIGLGVADVFGVVGNDQAMFALVGLMMFAVGGALDWMWQRSRDEQN